MAGLSGFDWRTAPLKWQVLDSVYLGLDLVVACGLAWRWRPSIFAFFAAAGSQILLYSAGRAWILDVPASHRPEPEALAHLDQLLVFHLVTLALVAASLAVLSRRQG